MSIYGTEDLFRSVIAEPKWYAGIMSVNAASMIKKRWHAGELSHAKIDSVLSQLGYRKIEIWEKVPKQKAA